MADMGEARFYPHGGAFAHVIGYVAKVSDQDVAAARERGETISEPDAPSRLPHRPSGGREGPGPGPARRARAARGSRWTPAAAIVRQDVGGLHRADPGKDVVLTLDADIQNRALEVFGEESGGCVVMDMPQRRHPVHDLGPGFDPNLFVAGVPGSVYRALADYERKPLLDKALDGTFPPGSTFKMITALAILDAGVDPDRAGELRRRLPLRQPRRSAATSRRPRLAEHARRHQELLRRLFLPHVQPRRHRPDRAAPPRLWASTRPSTSASTGQKKGTVPSTEWKRHAFRNNPNPDSRNWYPGETLSVAIGQGATEVNALQLAVMTARIANGRKALEPRLIKSVGGVERPSGAAVPDLPFSVRAPGHRARRHGGGGQ